MGFLEKAFTSLAGTLVLQAVTTITGVILSRTLGPDGMGRYQLLQAALVVAISLATTGMGQATIYFLNNRRVPPEKVIAAAGLFGILAGTIGGIGIYAVLHLQSYFGVFPEWMLVVTGITGLLMAVVNCVGPVLVAFLRVRQDAVQRNVPRMAALATVTLGFLAGALNVGFAIATDLLVHVLSVALLAWWLRGHLASRVPGTFRIMRDMVGMGMKLGLANVLYVFNVNIALMLVKHFFPGDFAAVGIYGRAVSIASLLLLIPTSVGPILYAHWASLAPRDRLLQVAKAMRLMLVVGGAACLFIVLLGKWVILILYGEAFLGAVSPLRILTLGILFRFLLSPLIQLFASSGRPMGMVVIMAANLVVMLAFMFVTTPLMGLDGAALAVTIGNLFGLALGVVLARQALGVRVGDFLRFHRDDFHYIWRALRRRRGE